MNCNASNESLKQPLLHNNINNKQILIKTSIYSQIKSTFIIAQYDEMCEDFSKIEKIICLKYDYFKIAFFLLINCFTFFFINLLLLWYPILKIRFIYSVCSLKDASFIGIFGSDNQFYVENLKLIDLPDIENSHLLSNCRKNIYEKKVKVFQFKYYDYVYDPIKENFASLDFLLICSHDKIHKNFSRGLSTSEYTYQKKLFNLGDIDVKVDSIWKLIYKTLVHPFYVYLISCIYLWYINEYVLYAHCIVVCSIISLTIEIYDYNNIQYNIKNMSDYSLKVKVLRRKDNNDKKSNSMLNLIADNSSLEEIDFTEKKKSKTKKNKKLIINKETDFIEVSSNDLVPGDLIMIPDENLIMPCDAILISGNVVINEALLTGESTPVCKVPISTNPNYNFHERKCRSNMIHTGTKLLQVKKGNKGQVLAVVLNTGFNTEKGNLVRSIIHPKDTEVKFKVDAVKYVFVMAALAIVGYFLSLPYLLEVGVSLKERIMRALDLFTDTVPPSLPFCIGIGLSFSIGRLNNKGIRCISAERMSDIGKVDLICLDKTGTLTEEELNINGFRRTRLDSSLYSFNSYQTNINNTMEESFTYYKEKMKGYYKENRPKPLELKQLFSECLASCHNICKVNNKLIGDPIDLEMFKESGWKFLENNSEGGLLEATVIPKNERYLKDKLFTFPLDMEDNIIKEHYELAIIKRYDFTSKLQRMSVIVKSFNEENYKVFTKGSPEKILELCRSETIPSNFNESLNKYTSKGFRVLGLAGKHVKMSYFNNEINREKLETNMIFLGLMIINNKLKDETIESIELLTDANQKMLMATGDNILTAIAVSKACKLISSDVKIFTCKIQKNKINDKNPKKYNIIWEEIERYDEEDDGSSSKEESKTELYSKKKSYFNSKESSSISADTVDDDESINTEEDLKNLILEKEEENNQLLLEELRYHLEEAPDYDNIRIGFDPKKMTNFMEEDFIIAIEGNTFEAIWKLRNNYTKLKNEKYKEYYELFRLILQNTAVYGRMAPDHKTILVESLKEENFIVLMCGDGANDCGALKAANVGVSLTKENSIAAHFTSEKQDISCIIEILKEGKCALVTAICCFKAMILYSMIQFLSVTFLMCIRSYLLDTQFLSADIAIVPALQVLMAYTEPSSTLTEHQPIGDLLSFPVLSSVICQSVINLSFLFIGHTTIEKVHGYIDDRCIVSWDIDDPVACDKNTVIFFIATMQYFSATVVFAVARPYRKPMYTNVTLLLYFTVVFMYFLKVFLIPDEYSMKMFEIVEFHNDNIKFYILLICIANFLLSYTVESIIIPIITRIYYRAKYFETLRKTQNKKYNPNLQELHDIKKEAKILEI